ncbi:FGGY family carbohydrate kinase [Candidatus Latescibacterota bacterium]
MEEDIVIVVDCGSTNITISAVDALGNFVKSSGSPNAPTKQPGCGDSFFIWDFNSIWGKICNASREVCSSVNPNRIKAVIVTTFGADGTFLDSDNNPVYPVISWQDTRTEETAEEITSLIDPKEIYDITGYNIIRFNTMLRFLWLSKHAPEVLEKADKYMMMPGLISHKLSGEVSIDSTSAGTMMAMDMKERKWSEKMLGLAGMDSSYFPKWVDPGETIGTITAEAGSDTGLPVGIPVITGGHDTQFALVGSGASQNEAVLSSGTWEILMARTKDFSPNDTGFENGINIEYDSVPGVYNPQMLMMGSGVLEWVRKAFFAKDDTGKGIYDIMISEARKIQPASSNVFFCPTFVSGTGPFQKFNSPGYIYGLNIMTSRSEIYRAALEGLAFQLKSALEVLNSSTGFNPEGIRVVGGGARNMLWNNIRADVTGLPVTVTSQTEITALGAALFAFKGIGTYGTIEEAVSNVNFSKEIIEPTGQTDIYEKKYSEFMRIPRAILSM